MTRAHRGKPIPSFQPLTKTWMIIMRLPKHAHGEALLRVLSPRPGLTFIEYYLTFYYN